MTTKEITELPLGSKVYLIKDAEITTYITLHDTLCLYLKSNTERVWETDYEKAKEIMWEQLQQKVKNINSNYFNNSKSTTFELDEVVNKVMNKIKDNIELLCQN